MTLNERKLKVLIVEDEAVVAILLEDMIAELGHEVAATVGRLDSAMNLAGARGFDLAVVDVNLNGESSFPLAAALSDRDIPFVFATGYGISAIEARWAGVPTLQKPFQTRELGAAIARALAAPGTEVH